VISQSTWRFLGPVRELRPEGNWKSRGIPSYVLPRWVATALPSNAAVETVDCHRRSATMEDAFYGSREACTVLLVRPDSEGQTRL